MTLRTRFTVAVAGAVAAVALAITAVAFFVVRADLTNQVKHELGQQAAVVKRLAWHYHGHIPAGWVPEDSDRFGATSAYTQVITAQGSVWAPSGDSGLLPGTSAAAQVAAGHSGPYFTETTLNGVRAMVLTTPLASGLAVQLAVPLNAVDQELGAIGATLALLSLAGVGLAALAGWGVARAGLAPVGRLAAVAEQVTATGNPSRRVEVDRGDELGRLAASFNTMLAALQRSLAAQRQLVSDASHELRTPLTSLRINAELLAAEPGLPEAERQEVLDRMVAQVTELSQLVAGVTELARGEMPDEMDGVPGDETSVSAGAVGVPVSAGGGPAGEGPAGGGSDSAGAAPAGAAPAAGASVGAASAAGASGSAGAARVGALVNGASVDLAEVAAAAVEVARRDWPRTVFAANLEPWVVSGQAERLKTAVRNLLDNAAKFSPPDTVVDVRLHAGELTVRDYGPGIPPDDLPRVFDRFYRAAAARGVPGSGLGLSIVRQVAEGHGGTVRAEAPADGGTLIRFRLPAPERGPGAWAGPALAPTLLAGSATRAAGS